MEKIPFIVDRLNQPPFSKGFASLTDLDYKSSLELLEMLCEIIISIDPDQGNLVRETSEFRVQQIFQFLNVMKYPVPAEQGEYFMNMMMDGDKDVLHDVMFWCLQGYDRLKKRAYLAKYLMPVDVPAEFLSDPTVDENLQHLKEFQAQFKDIHKNYDQMQNTGVRPSELKAEIAQLEKEKSQLENKIQKLQKDTRGNEAAFKTMLAVTSSLRKEQEEEAKLMDRIRDHRMSFQDSEKKLRELTRRLNETRKAGVQQQSPEVLLDALQREVRELYEKKRSMENDFSDRSAHLQKLQNWENSDRAITEDDVNMKREELRDMQENMHSLSQRLESALERNDKLSNFHQVCVLAAKKLRENEEENEKLTAQKTKLLIKIDEREAQIRTQGKGRSRADKAEMDKYKAQVGEKVKEYKLMRDELASNRAELVVLQRTELILKSRHKNLDEFLAELERKKGVEGYRETQRTLVEYAEKTAAVDQLKGATLEKISSMVETIGKELKSKQQQLQPMMADLKALRQEYMDVESKHGDRKNTYEKVAVGLEMEKQALEKQANELQDECLREESRYHYLNSLIVLAKLKLERAEQEKKWRNGSDRMMRDFSCLKDLYTHKIVQQDQLTKQLRTSKNSLQESSSVMSNQKTLFRDLAALLDLKLRISNGTFNGGGMASNGGGYPNELGADVMSF